MRLTTVTLHQTSDDAWCITPHSGRPPRMLVSTRSNQAVRGGAVVVWAVATCDVSALQEDLQRVRMRFAAVPGCDRVTVRDVHPNYVLDFKRAGFEDLTTSSGSHMMAPVIGTSLPPLPPLPSQPVFKSAIFAVPRMDLINREAPSLEGPMYREIIRENTYAYGTDELTPGGGCYNEKRLHVLAGTEAGFIIAVLTYAYGVVGRNTSLIECHVHRDYALAEMELFESMVQTVRQTEEPHRNGEIIKLVLGPHSTIMCDRVRWLFAVDGTCVVHIPAERE